MEEIKNIEEEITTKNVKTIEECLTMASEKLGELAKCECDEMIIITTFKDKDENEPQLSVFEAGTIEGTYGFLLNKVLPKVEANLLVTLTKKAEKIIESAPEEERDGLIKSFGDMLENIKKCNSNIKKTFEENQKKAS